MITQERLKELLNYNPETGHFTWLAGRGGTAQAGSRAGSLDDGYVTVGIDRKRYQAHRLAILYMAGSWPLHDVDHKDLDRSNNVWTNLRPATTAQNNCNRSVSKTNKLGVKNVSMHRGKFRVDVSGKHIGCYKTLEEAIVARDKAAKEIQGDFAFVS